MKIETQALAGISRGFGFKHPNPAAATCEHLALTQQNRGGRDRATNEPKKCFDWYWCF